MDLAQLKEKGKMEEEKKYQEEMNNKLIEWEEENKVSVQCVNIPLQVTDNPAKIILESRLWFNKLGEK